MFEIGDKVVCVDDKPQSPHTHIIPCGYPVKGAVYTVESLIRIHHSIEPDRVIIVGLPVFWKKSDTEFELSGWGYFRFRKLSDMQNEARERCKQHQPA